MKKKILIGFVSVALLLTAGVAIAGSPIKILVNGQQIYSDVAPFIKDGRTMVPLRIVSEALGAGVQWDNNTQTVFITENTKRDLKLYSKISNHYQQLEQLGINLQGLSKDLTIAGTGVVSLNTTSYIGTANSIADTHINTYNGFIQSTSSLIAEANNQGINISDMKRNSKLLLFKISNRL